VANTQGSDTNPPPDWYDDPLPDWDAEWVSRRTAELGPGFEALVSMVTSRLGCPSAKRDQVRRWLINCLDRYKAMKNVQAPVKKWLEDVGKNAAALANLLDCGPPFPPGSSQADFSFVYEDACLPDTYDIARLRKVAQAAEVLARGYRKVGAPRRADRDGLIGDLQDGFDLFASKRASVNAVCEVVGEVLAFIGERLAPDTVSGAVKRMRKRRRRWG
jgi:hypothetical protein